MSLDIHGPADAISLESFLPNKYLRFVAILLEPTGDSTLNMTADLYDPGDSWDSSTARWHFLFTDEGGFEPEPWRALIAGALSSIPRNFRGVRLLEFRGFRSTPFFAEEIGDVCQRWDQLRVLSIVDCHLVREWSHILRSSMLPHLKEINIVDPCCPPLSQIADLGHLCRNQTHRQLLPQMDHGTGSETPYRGTPSG